MYCIHMQCLNKRQQLEEIWKQYSAWTEQNIQIWETCLAWERLALLKAFCRGVLVSVM